MCLAALAAELHLQSHYRVKTSKSKHNAMNDRYRPAWAVFFLIIVVRSY